MSWKKLAKGIIFVMIFLLLFSGFSKILNNSGDTRNYQRLVGFYEEPKNSLDAVYIGSSTCYAYWNSLAAWKQYGVAVYPYSTNAQHFVATEYLVKEVRKYHPDAMIVVNINTIDDSDLVVEKLHHLLDYMPLSLNKLQLTKHLSDCAGLTWEESLELYVPLYRYHERWSNVHMTDIYLELNNRKGASSYSTYLGDIMDLTDSYRYESGTAELPQYLVDATNSLLDYCEKEDVNILFVTAPRVESEEHIKKLNALNALIEARGFDTLNLLAQPELCQLDLSQDFYNKGHTNLRGSLKFTQFVTQYLIEHYGLADHRGESAYSSWDDEYASYQKILSKHMLGFEVDPGMRTTQLDIPGNLAAVMSGDTVALSWNASEGADGYAVYRKPDNAAWEQLATTTELTYKDVSVESGALYTYTVVPYLAHDGQLQYGNYSYAGTQVQVP